eukprot:SAG11_NODE_4571_length_1847_cov_3.699085_3_plen_77_part_00
MSEVAEDAAFHANKAAIAILTMLERKHQEIQWAYMESYAESRLTELRSRKWKWLANRKASIIKDSLFLVACGPPHS